MNIFQGMPLTMSYRQTIFNFFFFFFWGGGSSHGLKPVEDYLPTGDYIHYLLFTLWLIFMIFQIVDYWLPIIRNTLPEDGRKPIILVGNKSDTMVSTTMEVSYIHRYYRYFCNSILFFIILLMNLV